MEWSKTSPQKESGNQSLKMMPAITKTEPSCQKSIEEVEMFWRNLAKMKNTQYIFQRILMFSAVWTNENVEPISNKKPAFHWKLLFQLDMQNLMDPSNSAIHGLVQWPIFMLVDLASNFCINQVGNPCSYKKHTARDGVGLLELPT